VPEYGECWNAGTATFMILGNVCTRSCGFCAVTTGRPVGLDREEPTRVAEAIKTMGIRHAVITSVNRDELPDGGASIFAETIRHARSVNPGVTIEVLIPDFRGVWEALQTVIDARPDILNHNVETVPRLYARVRPRRNTPARSSCSRGRKRKRWLPRAGLWWVWGDPGGGAERAGRSAERAVRYCDNWAVPPTDEKPPAGGALRSS